MNIPTKEGKNIAVIAHFTIVGSLIAMSMNGETKSDFARFYTRQAFGIHLLFIAFSIFNSLYFSQLALYGIYVTYIVLWGYSFIAALNNKKQSIPVLGPYFQKWFTFIQY